MMEAPPDIELTAAPVLLYLTAEDDQRFRNTSFNSSLNQSGGSSETSSDSDLYETYLLYHVIYYMTQYPWLLLVLGVPGNVASIFTIMTMSTVSSSKAHVAILAIADTVAIISKVFYWQASGHYLHLTGPGCVLVMFVQQFSTTYANWVVVAMTTERFLAVCFPLRVGHMYTRRKALVVLSGLALLTSSVYAFFFWAWTESHEPDYGFYCHILKPDYDQFMAVFYWVDGFYSAVLPCLLILLGNVLIILNIKRARKAQRHLTNAVDQGGRKARDQKQITIMLIVVSLVFLLLNVPSAVFYFLKSFWTYQESSYQQLQREFTARFVHLLADVNQAVNFYLYFLSMSSFRRRFLDAVRCRRHWKRRPMGGSLSRTSQTYVHSGHHFIEPSRTDSGFSYSTYKRSNSHLTEHPLPMKTLTGSSGGRAGLDYQVLDSRNGVTASCSDV